MKTYSNPICYAKRAMKMNVDACNLVGVAKSTVYNGTLVTLGKLNAGDVAGKGYVYEVTPTTANTDVDVWMVISPEVNRELETNVIVDPRAFEIPAGRPFDIIRPMPTTDHIIVDANAFTAEYDPVTVIGAKYATADANGKMKAVVSASGVTGIVYEIKMEEVIPVGQEMVKGWILKCIQNPAPALA